MICSMTGFGSAEGNVGTVGVTVELRSVNHRFFNPSIKLPAALAKWEAEVRDVLKASVSRGHVSLLARIERDAAVRTAVNETRFAEYVELLRGLQARHGLDASLNAATVLSLPGVVDVQGVAFEAEAGPQLLSIVADALKGLREMRREEGSRLAVFLLDRVSIIEAAVTRVSERAPQRLADQNARLLKVVNELTGSADVDAQRLAQEVAIMADRLDIAEEIDRFNSHIAAFRGTISAAGGDAVGKRLGFLLQEMVREANTTGSKANDIHILADVVVVKEELERIREQVENIE